MHKMIAKRRAAFVASVAAIAVAAGAPTATAQDVYESWPQVGFAQYNDARNELCIYPHTDKGVLFTLLPDLRGNGPMWTQQFVPGGDSLCLNLGSAKENTRYTLIVNHFDRSGGSVAFET